MEKEEKDIKNQKKMYLDQSILQEEFQGVLEIYRNMRKKEIGKERMFSDFLNYSIYNVYNNFN